MASAQAQCSPAALAVRMSVSVPLVGPYTVNLVLRQPLVLVEGSTYTVTFPTGTNWPVPTGHPWVFTTDPDGGAANGGTAQHTPTLLPGYTVGGHCSSCPVNTFVCTPGPLTPSVFFYQCTTHVNLGAQVTVLRLPVINSQPVPVTSCGDGDVTFTVGATLSQGTLSYQWRRNSIDVPGPEGTLPTLIIQDVRPEDLGTYDCVVSNQCATVTSAPATLSVCPADLANNTGSAGCDGGVDINDLLYFLGRFESGDAAVDLDNGTGTGTPDGGVDISDLLFFLVRFEGGC